MPSIRESLSRVAGGLEPDGIQSVRRVDWRAFAKATGDRSPGQGNDADGDVVVVMSAEARASAGYDRPMSPTGSSTAAPSTPPDRPASMAVATSTAAPLSDRSDPAARDGAAPAADPAASAADPEITLMMLSRERASARDGINPTDQASYGLYRRAASAYAGAGGLGAIPRR